MRCRPTYLLLSLVVVRTVVVNGILETHGPPAFARGMLVHLLMIPIVNLLFPKINSFSETSSAFG
jgi:hypothetical protein